jgi:hypothetical protein
MLHIKGAIKLVTAKAGWSIIVQVLNLFFSWQLRLTVMAQPHRKGKPTKKAALCSAAF